MVHTHRSFRFTIGQGMIVIAALAVAFAIMPMPLAIDVAFATACLVGIAHNRSRTSNVPTLLSEPVGCLFVLLGLLAAWRRYWRMASHVSGTIANRDPWVTFFICSLIAGLFGATRLRRSKAFRSRKHSPRIVTRLKAELKLVEHLLRRAHKDGDELSSRNCPNTERNWSMNYMRRRQILSGPVD